MCRVLVHRHVLLWSHQLSHRVLAWSCLRECLTCLYLRVATGILDDSVEAYYAIGAEWKMLAIIWGVGGIPGRSSKGCL